MEACEAVVAEFAQSAEAEAAGEEPFEVAAPPDPSPRGESAPETAAQRKAKARAAHAEVEKATRAARKPQEATPADQGAVVPPEPSEAPGGSEAVKIRAALAAAFLRLPGEYAAQVERVLSEDDLWPIDSIPDELVDEATELAAPIFEAAAAAVKR
jgi:hypothetical protein